MSGSDLCTSRNETVWSRYFQKKVYNVLSLNFRIHVSVSNLYIPGSVYLFCCSSIGRPMVGNWEYINCS